MAKVQTTTNPMRDLARHALHCTACSWKARRLLEHPRHLERQELLCAIEWCLFRQQGRQVHA